MYRLLLTTVAFVLLVFNGVLSGLSTDRWTVYPEAEVAAAGAKFDKVSLTIGKWDGRDLAEDGKTLPEEIVGQNILRRYVDRNNGTAMTIFLTCGETRPMWYGHLPTECYPGAGYKLVAGPERCSMLVGADPAIPPATLWAATFSMDGTSSPPVHLRVFWSWSGDGSWQAPDHPHRTFARYPFLYKLYVIRRLLKPDERLDRDPCQEFLGLLLPELKKSLF
jgi:hypothetical protein